MRSPTWSSLLLVLLPVALSPACNRAEKGSTADDPSTRLGECEALDGRGNADACYERTGVGDRNPGYCERIVGPRTKNACFQKIAAVADKPELCAKIDEAPLRAACTVEVAKKRGNPELCHKLEQEDAQANCVKELAIHRKNDGFCEAIRVVATRAACLGELAIEKPELCARIGPESDRDACFSRALTAFGAARDSASLCARISDAKLKDGCWSRYSTLDPLLCEKVVDPATQVDCYRAALADSPAARATTCPKISRAESADICFRGLAVQTGDLAVCERIKATEPREECAIAVGCSKATSLKHKQRCAAMASEAHRGITRISATEYTVTRSTMDHLFANQTKLLGSVRMVPEMLDGKVAGMRFFGVRNENVLGALGLQNGDRVERLNGFPVGSPEQWAEAAAHLRSANAITADISRRGEAVRLSYKVR